MRSENLCEKNLRKKTALLVLTSAKGEQQTPTDCGKRFGELDFGMEIL